MSGVVLAVFVAVYVGMFLYKSLYLTAGLYAVFFVLAVMGYREWKRSFEERARSEELRPLAARAS